MAETKSSIIDVPVKNRIGDALDINVYVQALDQFLTNAATPLTVAIQGEWGSGKTSFMNQIHEDLCGADKPFFGIWTRAWEYAMLGDPQKVLLAMIQGMIRDIEQQAKTEGNSVNMSEAFHKARSVFVRMAELGVQAAAAQVGVSSAAVSSLFSENGKKSSIEDLKDALEQAVQESLMQANMGKSSRQMKKTGFIFFIDDLDRLDPVVAVQFLELMKNIFDLQDCIFVLAIDYEVVVKGLKPKFGPRTEENDREFRSFFDKIIQVPFSIPTSAYNMGKFLTEHLQKIGYVNGKEITQKRNLGDYSCFIPGTPSGTKQVGVDQIFTALTKFSTGANPRAVKRMLNTLSLIGIIQECSMKAQKDAGQDITDLKFDLNQKLICFCLVSLQIAYPAFYNLLLSNPVFIEWDDVLARKRGYISLKEEEKDTLNDFDEFDEDWEKFVYRACQTTTYLKSRSSAVSSIFNILRGLILLSSPIATSKAENETEEEAEKRIIKDAVRKALGMSAITGLAAESEDSLEEKRSYTMIRYATAEEFKASLEAPFHRAYELFLNVQKAFDERFGDNIEYEYAKQKVVVKIRHNRTREKNLAKIELRAKGYLLKFIPGGMNAESCLPLKQSPAEITDATWKYLRDRFNKFSDDYVDFPTGEAELPSAEEVAADRASRFCYTSDDALKFVRPE